MEGIQAQSSGSTPAPVAATPPVSTPPVAEATPPMPQSPYEPAPIMQDGGAVGSKKGFFNQVNWIEAGFAILGVTALLYTIHYYRFRAKQDKMVNNELQRQIDEIKMNVQGSMKGKYKTI